MGVSVKISTEYAPFVLPSITPIYFSIGAEFILEQGFNVISNTKINSKCLLFDDHAALIRLYATADC